MEYEFLKLDTMNAHKIFNTGNQIYRKRPPINLTIADKSLLNTFKTFYVIALEDTQ